MRIWKIPWRKIVNKPFSPSKPNSPSSHRTSTLSWVCTTKHMVGDGYISGIESAVKFSFFAKLHVQSSRPENEKVWATKAICIKVTWMEKLILTFLSRKLKLKRLLKYLKVRKVPARNFYCGECSKRFNWEIARKAPRWGEEKPQEHLFHVKAH